VDSYPAVIKEVPVKWPRAAERVRAQGAVVVQATVNASGIVEDVKVIETDEAGFGIPEAVMDAVRQYRFKPGMKNGVKIKTYVRVRCLLAP
jgi:TonB family protein